MRPNSLIMPSLLSAPYTHLEKSIRELEEAGARLFHYDVMDGHFVPNLSGGTNIIQSLEPVIHSRFDVHLMVTNPGRVIPWFGPHAPYVDNTEALLLEEVAVAREHGVGLHMHMAAGPEDNEETMRRYGLTATQALDRAGFFAGLAGIVMASRINSAQPSLGQGYELDAIAAAASRRLPGPPSFKLVT